MTKAANNKRAYALSTKKHHAVKNDKRPTYIGLRVIEYIPEVTKDVDESGFIGSNVVLAFEKLNKPVMPNAAPIAAKMTTIAAWKVSHKCIFGNTIETSHIAVPTITITATGGIFNSSFFIFSAMI